MRHCGLRVAEPLKRRGVTRKRVNAAHTGHSESRWQRSVSLPPHNTLWQPGEGSCQFMSDVLGKVLDPGTE